MLVTEPSVSSSAVSEQNTGAPPPQGHRLAEYFERLNEQPDLDLRQETIVAVPQHLPDSRPEASPWATQEEARRVAAAVSSYFSPVVVNAVYKDDAHQEDGYRLEFSLPTKHPWENNFIPRALAKLPGFELLLSHGNDFFCRLRPAFRINLDLMPEGEQFPEIKQRVFEGIFYYLAPLNGPIDI